VELYLHSTNTPSWRGALLKHELDELQGAGIFFRRPDVQSIPGPSEFRRQEGFVSICLCYSEWKTFVFGNFVANLCFIIPFHIIISVYIFLLWDLKINKTRNKLHVSSGPKALDGTRFWKNNSKVIYFFSQPLKFPRIIFPEA